MSHRKEPWTENSFGIQPSSNFKQVPIEDFKRAMICVNACKDISDEALQKGIIDDGIALVLNAGKDIGIEWRDGLIPYYDGVEVWKN